MIERFLIIFGFWVMFRERGGRAAECGLLFGR